MLNTPTVRGVSSSARLPAALASVVAAEEEDAREVAQLIRAAGRKAVTIPGDIKDEASAGLRYAGQLLTTHDWWWQTTCAHIKQPGRSIRMTADDQIVQYATPRIYKKQKHDQGKIYARYHRRNLSRP